LGGYLKNTGLHDGLSDYLANTKLTQPTSTVSSSITDNDIDNIIEG